MAYGGMQSLNTALSFHCDEDPEKIKILYKTGAHFEGKIVNYKKVGRGVFLWLNGSKYVGDYSENLRHGKGLQEWSDGSTYDGDFLHDLRHGHGLMCWSNGETYDGAYIKDRRHGKGTYEWADGSSYSGTFYIDNKQGYGTFYFANGDKFQGLYVKDEREGPGVMTYKDGCQDVALWKGEKLIKLCSEIKEAFTVKHLPDFDFKPEEHIVNVDINDEIHYLEPINDILNPPSVLDYEPKPDLTGRVGELFSGELHHQSLAVDRQTFDKEFFKGVSSNAKNPEKVVAWNNTPSMIVLQKNILKHKFGKTEVEYDVDALIKLDRSRFKEKGFLEQQSEELIKAAQTGNTRKVEELLNSQKVHPDVSDRHGHTALIGATVNWHMDIINLLLNHGADVNKVNDQGCSPLSAASGFYYSPNGFVYNIAEKYMNPAQELKNEDSQKDSSLSKETSNKEYRCHQIEGRDSKSNQTSSQTSDAGVFVSNSSLKSVPASNTVTNKLQSEGQMPIVPSDLDPSAFSKKVQTDGEPAHDVDSDFCDDVEGDIGESEKDLDDPEDFESVQSLRNFPIEVTSQLVERCATQLSQNELVVGRELSGNIEEGKARLLAITMSRQERMRETLKLLLRRGADPNSSVVPMPILFMAVKTADVEMVRLLLIKGANANIRLNTEKGGLYPLHIASALPGEEGVQITELLLDALADPNARAEEDDSFLNHFLEEEWSKDIISDVTKPLVGGRTALHIACSRDDNYKNAGRIVRLLLEHKADTNLICNGFSPLALAITSGNDLAVDELLMSGTDPSLPLTHGVGNALCVAANTQYEYRRTPESRLQLIDKLIKAGANILAPIPVGPKRIMGTAVDYVYHMFNQDRRIARVPYHALTPVERETYNARRKLLAHVADITRTKAVERERRRNLAEEEKGVRSQSPSPNFVYIGAGAKLPPGFKPKSASKTVRDLIKSSDTDNKIQPDIVETVVRKPMLKYCYECGRSVGVRLTACTRCKEVYYCSKTCKVNAWNSRHKEECIRVGGRSRSPSPKNRTENGIVGNKGKNIASSQQILERGKSLTKNTDEEKKQTLHKFRTGSPPHYEFVYIDNYTHN